MKTIDIIIDKYGTTFLEQIHYINSVCFQNDTNAIVAKSHWGLEYKTKSF